MEGTESTARERKTGKGGNQRANDRVLMSNKPLHRFLQKEPRSLGIAILFFGCAELLMGFQLVNEDKKTSNNIYIPFWQGTLFVVCGILSIYTDLRPSKKMVTVCLAMYVVSILGIIVSIGYRIHVFGYLSYRFYWPRPFSRMLTAVEALLFTSSVCVSALLIFLCVVARFALKSTHTQVIVQCVPLPPPSDTTSN